MTPDEVYALQEEAENGIVCMLALLGDNPMREGLVDTPKRWVKAMIEQCEGLSMNPEAQLGTTFDVPCDEMVVVKDLPFVSLCEHHLLPFTGAASIAYLPGDRVVGLSKLPRLLHVLSRRPQVQERLTGQIADVIQDVLAPLGVGVRMSAHHTCMSCRGVRSTGTMVTQALRGELRDEPGPRAEFLALVNGS